MCLLIMWSVILILVLHPTYSTTEGGVNHDVPLWVAKKGCASPLGLHDGRITDSQLSASSSYNALSVAKYARINRNDPKDFGAWCPNQTINMYPQKDGPYYDQYLQVDFSHLVQVRGIRTQGRTSHGGYEIVKKYRLNYTRLDSVAVQFGTVNREGSPKLFDGNIDANTIKDQWLGHTIVASSVRIIPQIYRSNQVCLRLELYGCNWTQGIISYTMPQGNSLTLKGQKTLKFHDYIYDGIMIDKTLSAGIGVLTDITLGSRDVRHHRGWIGWNRNLVTAPYIVFEFEKQRIFRSVTFYCNLRDSYNITVFSNVKVGSSMTAKKFDSMIKYETPVLSSGKFYLNYNVTVDICGATGKYVKCEFSYRADWMLISEVTFDSEVAGMSGSANLGCTPSPFPTATLSTKGTTTDEPLNVTVTVSGREGGTNGGLIAGIVCGTLVFIIALLGVVCWWRYKNWNLHGERPFNHFIKIELRPYNTSHGTQRISRLSSCVEEKIDADVELCPVYASITDTERMEGNTYEEPPLARVNTSTGKPSSTGMKKPPRNSVKKPTKPPPGPPVLVNGNTGSSKDAGPEKIPELCYADPATPSTPLLNEDLDSKDTYYAEPESPTVKGPQLQVPVLSLPDSSNGKQEEPVDGYYAEPESQKEKIPLVDLKLPKMKSKKSKKNKSEKGFKPVNPAELDRPVEQPVPQVVKPPATGYAEPIDTVNKNKNNNTDELFQNPVYEEIYSEPFQGVSGTSLYANPSDELARADTITEFPREKLTFTEKIGDGQFGEVHTGEAEDLEEFFGLEPTGSTTTVAIKVLKTDVAKDIKEDFFKEVKIMARLKHENVVQLLGVCRDDPMLMIVEYMVNGDLNQFLSERRLGSCSEVHSDKVLAYQALLYMAMQVSSGMKYISSLNYVHRDLATRNLLVGHSFTVKIADFGMSRNTYCKHYYRIRGKAVLPIRWMAPECILQGKFTTESDVWSFGVTLWEILTLARYPYSEISDEKVIENVQKIFYDVTTGAPIVYLEKPVECQADVYEMMRSCWCRAPADRPTFDRLYAFLKKHVKLSEITI